MITFKSITDDSLSVVHGWLRRPVPGKRVDIKQVEGRDGATVTELGYEPVTLSVKYTLLPAANVDSFIAARQGSGIFKRSDTPNRYWNARVISQIDIDKLYSTKECTVEFFFEDPFSYVESESTQTITSYPATIVNSGTAISKPLLRMNIPSAGTYVFTLNGTQVTITPTQSGIFYIDCDSMDMYYNTPTDLRNRSMTGNFPTLSVGNNTLSMDSGTITSFVVTKRTRYL